MDTPNIIPTAPNTKALFSLFGLWILGIIVVIICYSLNVGIFNMAERFQYVDPRTMKNIEDVEAWDVPDFEYPYTKMVPRPEVTQMYNNIINSL